MVSPKTRAWLGVVGAKRDGRLPLILGLFDDRGAPRGDSEVILVVPVAFVGAVEHHPCTGGC